MNSYICPHCLGRFSYTNLWYKCPVRHDADAETKHAEALEDFSGEKPKGLAKAQKKMYYDARQREEALKEIIVEDCSNGVFRQEPISKGLFHKTLSMPELATCYYCGNKRVTTHICPNPECRKEINIDVNEKQFIVNLAGLKSSGKSVFLGALLYEIQSKLKNITNKWTIKFNDTATVICNEYKRYMTGKGGDIKATQDQQTEPVIVSFKDGVKRTYSFIFYDVAGEVLSSEGDMVDKIKSAKQFSYPDFIILLSDPINYDSIRRYIRDHKEELDESVIDFFGEGHINSVALDEMLNNETFVSNVREFIKQIIIQYGTDDEVAIANEKLDAPVAVCLSMMDILRKVYDPFKAEFSFLRPSSVTIDDCSGFFTEHPKKSAALKKQLEVWHERAFVNAIENNFKKNSFFSVSSEGEQGKVEEIDDLRVMSVLDPFIWILSHVQGDGSDVKFFDKNAPRVIDDYEDSADDDI